MPGSSPVRPSGRCCRGGDRPVWSVRGRRYGVSGGTEPDRIARSYADLGEPDRIARSYADLGEPDRGSPDGEPDGIRTRTNGFLADANVAGADGILARTDGFLARANLAGADVTNRVLADANVTGANRVLAGADRVLATEFLAAEQPTAVGPA